MKILKKFGPEKFFSIAAVLISFVGPSTGINLGLLAGDNKKHIKPISINKISRHSPVFINIRPGSLPKLPTIKVPTLPTLKPGLSSLKSSFKTPLSLRKIKSDIKLRKLKSSLPLKLKLPISPPVLPLLPIISPPLVPPLLPIIPPLLPILPPTIPRLPILRPLKVSLLKSPLQKALGSELKPVIIPTVPDFGSKADILKKLLDLRKKGSLNAAEFIRFKKILLS